MNGRIGERALGNRAAHTILLAALILAVAAAPGSRAGAAAPKTLELPATVIAHINLTTPAGNRMVLERQGTKRYLFIEQASKAGWFVIDVTQPEFSAWVNRPEPANADAKDTNGAKVENASQTTAVPEAPDAASKTSIPSNPNPADTVKLMDLSDPDKPATVQTINNVSSFLADAGRSVIFVTNDEGLWVLKFHRERVEAAKKKPPCDMKPTGSPMSQASRAMNCQ